jgi:hypothetical protein
MENGGFKAAFRPRVPPPWAAWRAGMGGGQEGGGLPQTLLQPRHFPLPPFVPGLRHQLPRQDYVVPGRFGVVLPKREARPFQVGVAEMEAHSATRSAATSGPSQSQRAYARMTRKAWPPRR